ncbi:MAG: hypothetical protein QXK88_04670 [Desulfurococcaceae archaeon]
MSRRMLAGFLSVLVSIIVLKLYVYLLFFSAPEIQSLTLKLTVFVMFLIFISIFLIIGVGLLRTPNIPPLREIDNNEEKVCVDHHIERGE